MYNRRHLQVLAQELRCYFKGEVAFVQSAHPLSSQEYELARQKGLKLNTSTCSR